MFELFRSKSNSVSGFSGVIVTMSIIPVTVAVAVTMSGMIISGMFVWSKTEYSA